MASARHTGIRHAKAMRCRRRGDPGHNSCRSKHELAAAWVFGDPGLGLKGFRALDPCSASKKKTFKVKLDGPIP